MTEAEIIGSLVQWLAEITGALVMQAYQEGDEPEVDYIVVEFQAMRTLNEHPIAHLRTDTGNTTPEGKDEILETPVLDTEWQFSLNAYGDDPVALLRKVEVTQHVGYSRLPLEPLKLHEVGTINALPEFKRDAWENRAQANLFLRGLRRDGVIIETIEEAPVTFERV